MAARTQDVLALTFQWKGWHFQSRRSTWPTPMICRCCMPARRPLRDLSAGLKRVLVLGLGGGVISTYLGRFLPDATIDTVELDPGVIDVAKKIFGVRETASLACSRATAGCS